MLTAFISGCVAPAFFDNTMGVSFFIKHTGITLKTSQTYRTSYIPLIVKEKQKSILKDLENKDFALYFDETTDTNGRYILNIMAKVLDGTDTKTMLMDTIELARTNTENVVDAIKLAVGSIVLNNNLKTHFKVLLSDGAAYCVKAGKGMKKTFFSLLHIVCLWAVLFFHRNFFTPK